MIEYKMQKLKNYCKNPQFIIAWLFFNFPIFAKLVPDAIYLKIIFKKKAGYNLNLKNPKTFNEKLQWLKLHDRNPIYTQLVDKYEVRKYIAERIDEEHLIPLLGVWDSIDEIDFEKLPNKFVLKCTHDSGSVIICKNKNSLDFHEIKKKLRQGLKGNYYYNWREWPYKNIKPRIIAEKYIEDDSGQLNDYKIFCFNGEPKYCLVNFDRFTEHKRNAYDTSWNFLNLELNYTNDENKQILKPQKLDEMLELARKLSTGIIHVRVDLYYVENKSLPPHIFFGEFTFYNGGGFSKFKPFEWDRVWGDCIELPKEEK